MARQRDQGARRAQLRLAMQRVIARHGLDGARLARVAEVARVSPGTVLYYYPDVHDLVLEAIRLGIDRFDEHRRALVADLTDATARLESLVRHGLPQGGDDTEVRMFNQLGGSAGDSLFAATLLTSLFDRQVALYQLVLEQGRAEGSFCPALDSLSTARNIVALEDAYGYRIVAGHAAIDARTAAELILGYATLATGHAFSGRAAAPLITESTP